MLGVNVEVGVRLEINRDVVEILGFIGCETVP